MKVAKLLVRLIFTSSNPPVCLSPVVLSSAPLRRFSAEVQLVSFRVMLNALPSKSLPLHPEIQARNET
jgi:hypothetical protein